VALRLLGGWLSAAAWASSPSPPSHHPIDLLLVVVVTPWLSCSIVESTNADLDLYVVCHVAEHAGVKCMWCVLQLCLSRVNITQSKWARAPETIFVRVSTPSCNWLALSIPSGCISYSLALQ
jgi:hypothetical protein